MQRSFGTEDMVKGLKGILTDGRPEPRVSRCHWTVYTFFAQTFSWALLLKGKRCKVYIAVSRSPRQAPGCLGTPSTSSRVCRTPPSTCPSTLWRIYFREGWWTEVSLDLPTSSAFPVTAFLVCVDLPTLSTFPVTASLVCVDLLTLSTFPVTASLVCVDLPTSSTFPVTASLVCVDLPTSGMFLVTASLVCGPANIKYVPCHCLICLLTCQHQVRSLSLPHLSVDLPTSSTFPVTASLVNVDLPTSGMSLCCLSCLQWGWGWPANIKYIGCRCLTFHLAIVTVCVVMVQAGADEPGGVGLHLSADGPLPQPVQHPQGNAGLSASRVPVLVPRGRAHVWQGPGPEPPHLLHLLPHRHVAQRQVSFPPSPLCPLVVVFVMLGLCHVVVVFAMLLWSLLCCCGLCHVVVVFAMLLWSLPCCCHVVVVFAMLLWSLLCCGFCHVVVVFAMLLWSLPCCCHVVVVFAMLLWSLLCCGFCHVVLALLSCCGLCHVVVVFGMLWSSWGKAAPKPLPSLYLSNRSKKALFSYQVLCTCQTEAKWPCLHGRCFVLVKQRQNDPVYMEGALYLSNRGKMTLSTWKVLCTCQTEAKWTFMPRACLASSQ